MVRRIIAGLFVLVLVAGTAAAGEGEKTSPDKKQAPKRNKRAFNPEQTLQWVEKSVQSTERELKRLEERLPNYPEGEARRLAEETKQTLMDRLAALKALKDATDASNNEEALKLRRSLGRYNLAYEKRQVLRLYDENIRLQAQMERYADDPDAADAVKRMIALNLEMAGLLTRAADMQKQKSAIQQELNQKQQAARAKARAARREGGGKKRDRERPAKKAAPEK